MTRINQAALAVIALTLFNLGMLAWNVQRLRQGGAVSWRKVFAALPVPMLGIGGSYGVYAFNLMFVPPWVAAISAAAYETVYLGIPALDDLTPEETNAAKRVALAAAWVSFAQNALAALFYTAAGAKLLARVDRASLWVGVLFFAVGALLHAALVWINFYAADLVLHRNAAKRPSAKPAGAEIISVSAPSQPAEVAPAQPAALPEPAANPVPPAARQPSAPERQPANANGAAPAQTGKTIKIGNYPPELVDHWIALNDGVGVEKRLGYRAIEKAGNGAWPSHVTIRAACDTRRAERTNAAAEPIPNAARAGVIGLATFMDAAINAPAEVAPEAPTFTLDDILRKGNMTADEARRQLDQYGVKTAERAWRLMSMGGYIPEGMDRPTFDRLYAELMRAN